MIVLIHCHLNANLTVNMKQLDETANTSYLFLNKGTILKLFGNSVGIYFDFVEMPFVHLMQL